MIASAAGAAGAAGAATAARHHCYAIVRWIAADILRCCLLLAPTSYERQATSGIQATSYELRATSCYATAVAGTAMPLQLRYYIVAACYCYCYYAAATAMLLTCC